MLSFEDDRWRNFKGGYGVPFDPRPLLSKLETGQDDKTVWGLLWSELHHQGDVGEASYAAVPHLVRIYRQRNASDWNTYAIVATIELARGKGKNPDLPDWMATDFQSALKELAELGVEEILRAQDSETVRSILSIVALAKGARTHARFLLEYSDEELVDLETQAQESQ
jgi:hypothetical protein